MKLNNSMKQKNVVTLWSKSIEVNIHPKRQQPFNVGLVPVPFFPLFETDSETRVLYCIIGSISANTDVNFLDQLCCWKLTYYFSPIMNSEHDSTMGNVQDMSLIYNS